MSTPYLQPQLPSVLYVPLLGAGNCTNTPFNLPNAYLHRGLGMRMSVGCPSREQGVLLSWGSGGSPAEAAHVCGF